MLRRARENASAKENTVKALQMSRSGRPTEALEVVEIDA
jgi:hypothetical protein